jgi:hypothetical protein
VAQVVEAEPQGSNGFTTKEMLIRIDGKVDQLNATMAAKHAHYDVELALLKARDEERKAQVENLAVAAEKTAHEVRHALETREVVMDKKVDEVRAVQSETLRKLAYATGTVVGALAIFNAIQLFVRWHG